MPKAINLKPFKSARHPQYKWVVYWPGARPGDPRKSKRFRTKAAADAFLLDKETELTNHGRAAAALSENAVRETQWCLEQLSPFRARLRDVVTDFVARQRERNESEAFTVALCAFMRDKAQDGREKRYLRELRNRLDHLARDFPDAQVSDFTTATLDGWLRSLPGKGTTRNNYRRTLSSFFGWAMDRGFITMNPAARTAKANIEAEEIEIFTPAEVRVILEHAPTELLPVLAIGLFCGLRTVELSRLTWDKVNFTTGEIEVNRRANRKRGASRRFVPMPSALLAWIQPSQERGASGPVAPAGMNEKLRRYHRKLEDFRAAHGRVPVVWKQNAIRHSFGSYALAREEDAARVALWMGHSSTRVLFENYRERVTKTEAEAFFAIAPAPSNSVSIPSAAS
ncbi:MAG: tyrosine-type recombinase/integrase [Verrucomicrobiae bacterium]|nr:tyrosine-type recombinase/integrase [Verrucomicrobiae bacterium]